ncbi:MAG: hypothetical protein Ta2D_06750 [Rickettsiales bacterium]|nr:MAG: hypothetical protein Ta2D_06750 [Rickettsiales bacterium]
MNILYFNTIFGNIELILNEDSRIIECQKQSEYLVENIEKMLKDNNLDYKDIDFFATITGSGNFTNIKTNLAVAKALQLATQKKVIGSDLFEIIGYEENYDYIALKINPVKWHIKDKEGNYFVENKLDNFNGKVISEYSAEKWKKLTETKIKNNIFTPLEALYIENIKINKRKGAL